MVADRRLCGAEFQEIIMTLRSIGTLLACALFFICANSTLTLAQGASPGTHWYHAHKHGSATRAAREARGGDFKSRRATTVKSSKSNSSDRNWGERRGWRDREVRNERRGCKTVTVQQQTPRGMITRTRTRC